MDGTARMELAPCVLMFVLFFNISEKEVETAQIMGQSHIRDPMKMTTQRISTIVENSMEMGPPPTWPPWTPAQ